jgi:hypothetical protein
LDVVVEAEQVGRVAGALERDQAGVLGVAVGVPDPVGLVRKFRYEAPAPNGRMAAANVGVAAIIFSPSRP